jgi:hypothetical protein
VKIRCKEDLRIEDCDYSAEGATPAEVLGPIVDHLREEHDLDLPDPSLILEGKYYADKEVPPEDGTRIVVTRLMEALDIEPVEEMIPEPPAVSRIVGR